MISVEKTIVSQYANSPTITQLVKNIDAYIDPRADFDNFFNFVWNVDTAQGFGLDIWGRIVNVTRNLNFAAGTQFFGFNEALPGSYPFGEQPFYDQSQAFVMADDAYRQLILIKALANISRTTAPAINQLLQNLFAGRGKCYVNDMGGMQMRYTFEFALTPYEFAIVTQSGALPRPAGVGATLINVELPVFGFSEGGGYQPFGQAPFISEGAIHAIV